jgi:hypothetical protein
MPTISALPTGTQANNTDVVAVDQTASNGSVTTTKLTWAQVGALIGGGSGTSTLIIEGSVTTTDATPTLLPGLPALPNQRSLSRLTGQVTAQNTSSGDSSFLDVAVAVKCTGAGVAPALVGSASASVFAQDSSLAATTVVPSAGSAGPAITVTGIAGTSIKWAYTLTVVTAD